MKKSSLTKTLFLVYCFLLVWLVIFKLSFSLSDIKNLVGERSFNLIPFFYDKEVSMTFHRKEVLFNFAVFVPFGFYLKLLDIKTKRALLTGLALSFAMELLQFAFGLGAADITDLITNTAGSFFGVFVCIAAVKLFKSKEKLEKTFNVLVLIVLGFIAALAVLLLIANS